MVTRRLAPLVVAAALALAPVALDACQVMCTLHTAAAAPAAAHHACHGLAESRPDGGAEMRGVPHRCAHSDDLPATSTLLTAGVAPPAVVPLVASDQAPARHDARPFDTTPSPSPPRTATIGQLRV